MSKPKTKQRPVRTLNSRLPAAEICRRNGWEPGDVLYSSSDKVPHPRTACAIMITAIGEREILARRVEDTCEGLWTLAHRQWRRFRRATVKA